MIAVKHNLQLFDPEGTQPEAGSLILPVREAEAVMGETVGAYLQRVVWRFDLPTVCIINGEYYGRAEWPFRALALNDNIEFVSRPGGPSSSAGGSGAKSVMAIVALVALTAIAGPAGAAVSAALQGGVFGAVAGSLVSAAIVGSAAAPIAAWLAPPIPWWRRKLRAVRDSLRGILDVTARFWSFAR